MNCLLRHVLAKRFAEDCCKYGTENVNPGFPLVRVAQELGTSLSSIAEKRETMLETLNHQVALFYICLWFCVFTC